MYTNADMQQVKEAKQLWSLVLDTKKFAKSSSGLSRSSLNKIIQEAASRGFDHRDPREEVILTAKFIANIEPSYKNSDGQYVELTFLRTQVDFSKEDVDFLCDKIESIVKPYIVVSSTTEIKGNKLRVNTKMPKKKLIHAAVRHLINGSEIFNNPADYHELKARSLFIDNIKVSYAWLIGTAISLRYPSVKSMMEDMCLKFVDQTESINKNGTVTYYDGTVRIERL